MDDSDPDPDSDPYELIIILSLILVLTLINAFFASAEMAVVSLNKKQLNKLVEAGNKRAVILDKLVKRPTKFLSTIQVGITLAGFLSSAFAGANLSAHIAALFSSIGLKINLAVATVIITFLLSYFTLVFGELYPKRVALRNPEKVALRSACIINIMAIISTPFVRLLEASTNLVMKLTGMNKPTADEKVTEDEIRSLIVTGHIEGVIKEEEKELLENVFRFDDLTAAAIMTPRINVFAINIDKPLSEYIDEIIARGFSRVPVYERDIDNIIGILHVKDLLREGRSKGFNNIKLRDIMRKPYFVPEYMKIDVLFRNLQKTKNQIAILIDEYGGSVGIVTIEDLVEEIVGNIYDEYDAVDETIQPIDDKTYLVDAGIQIQELNRRLKLHLEENNEEYDTLGGMVIYLLGYIPTEAYQDEINYDNLVLKVHKVNANRIEEILLTIKEQNG